MGPEYWSMVIQVLREEVLVLQYRSCALAFEFASATICALAFDSQLELECTESEGSRKSGSAILMDAQNPVYDEAGA
jgi:hypothetical protein